MFMGSAPGGAAGARRLEGDCFRLPSIFAFIDFAPGSQDFRHTPGLRKAAARFEWCIRIHDFTDLSDAALAQVRGNGAQEFQRRRCVGMNPVVRARKGSEQPGPYRTLVIGPVAFAGSAAVAPDIAWIAWSKGAQAHGSPQFRCADGEDTLRSLAGQQRMRQRQGEDLVRTQTAVAAPAGVVDIALRSIDNVTQIAAGIEPKGLLKVGADSGCERGVVGRVGGKPELAREVPRDGGRVEPQGVDLHGLADARGDDPVTDFGVQPSQLHSVLTGSQQSISWIDLNAEARAARVPVQHVFQRGIDFRLEAAIAGVLEISVYGDEEPQTGVHRVVLRSLAAVGEAVRQHALTHEPRKGAQYAERDFLAARGQGQTGEGDHGVAAPIAEPGITRDDGLAERRSAGIATLH